MKKAISILTVIILCLTLSSCKKNHADTINFNLDGEPSTLDPQSAEDTSSLIVVTNLFEGLTRLDETETAIPGVAKTWESNPGKTRYTFYLRKDATWSDKEKTPVTANDFLFAIQRAISPHSTFPNANNLYSIKNAQAINGGQKDISTLGVKTEDDYTITFELEYPVEDFPKLLANAIFMPCNKKFFDSTSGQYGREVKSIISNGPFKFSSKTSWDHFKKISLTKNEDYKSDLSPICNGILFSIGKEISDPLKMVTNGEIDVANISYSQLEQAKKDKYNLKSSLDTIVGVTFNLSDEFFKNLNIRKSILSSLNRDEILESKPEDTIASQNIILDQAKIDGKLYRQSAGNSTLIQSDPNPKDILKTGLSELKAEHLPANTTIMYIDDQKTNQLMNNVITDLNKKLGHYFNKKAVSRNELDQKILEGNFQIVLYPLRAKSINPIDYLKIFGSSNNSVIGP